MLSGMNTKFLGNLNEKIDAETKSIIGNQDKDTFNIKIGNVTYNVMYSILYIISRVVTDDNILLSAGSQIEGNALEVLTKKTVEYLKESSKQSRNNRTQYNNKLNTLQTNISRAVLISERLDIIEMLRQSIDGKHPINIAIVSESVQTVVGSIWTHKHEHRIANYANIHALILYYWAYKNYSCIREEVDKENSTARSSGIVKKLRGYTLYKQPIKDDETAEQFIRDQYNDDHISDTLLQYIKKCNINNIGYSEYLSFETIVELLRYQNDNNQYIRNDIKSKESNLDLDRIGNSGNKLADKITDMLGVSTTDKVIVSSVNIMQRITNTGYDIGLMLAYLYKTTPSNNEYYKYIVDLLEVTIFAQRELAHLVAMSISAVHCMAATKTMLTTIEKNKGLQEKIDKLTSENDRVKAETRALRKELRERQKSIEQLESEVRNYASKDKLGLTLKDIEEMQAKIKRLEESIDKSNDIHNNTNRKLSKQDRKVEELNAQIDTLERSKANLQAKYDKAIEDSKNAEAINKHNAIPIECFVNSIKDKNIVIIGGDSIFNKIAEYGFSNVKTISSSINSIKTEELIGADVIVLMVKFLSHSTYYSAMDTAKINGIEIIKCNNTNVQMLIYSLFEILNK